MRRVGRSPQIFHTLTTARAAGFLAAALAASLAVAACGKDSPTSPTTTTTPAVPPTTIETFDGTVPVGGSAFYSFTIDQSGTVNITLVAVSGTYVPATVMLGLGIGAPSGTACPTTTSVNSPAGPTAQLTGTYGPGVFCANVSDIGNLFAPATFTATIEHP